MSYLYRSGTGRNNIAFTNTANSSTKYLRRLGSGRTNINWTTIPAGSTYNILNRTGTGRNNIAWGNLNIPKPEGSFETVSDIPSGDDTVRCTSVQCPIGFVKGDKSWYIYYIIGIDSSRSYVDSRYLNLHIDGSNRITDVSSESTVGTDLILFIPSITNHKNVPNLLKAQKMSINIPSQNTKITARIKTGTRNINQVRFNCIDIVKHSGPDVTTLYNWANQITDDLAEDITVVFSSTW